MNWFWACPSYRRVGLSARIPPFCRALFLFASRRGAWIRSSSLRGATRCYPSRLRATCTAIITVIFAQTAINFSINPFQSFRLWKRCYKYNEFFTVLNDSDLAIAAPRLIGRLSHFQIFKLNCLLQLLSGRLLLVVVGVAQGNTPWDGCESGMQPFILSIRLSCQKATPNAVTRECLTLTIFKKSYSELKLMIRKAL